MKLKLDRIISIATLIASVTAIMLVLRKPAPVVRTPAPAVIVQQAPAADRTSAEPQQRQQSAPASSVSDGAASVEATPARSTVVAPGASSRSNSSSSSNFSSNSNSGSKTEGDSDAISSALSQMLGLSAGKAVQSPDSSVGNGNPVIKEQQVTMDGDVVHGKFLTEIGGKDVWVTISGHMGEKDGFATFDPTEFKVGDTSIPVALVNPALQRKLAEERDRLKLTDKSEQ